MRRISRVGLAFGATLLALFALATVRAPAASAECTAWMHPSRATMSDFAGYAFSATVLRAFGDDGRATNEPTSHWLSASLPPTQPPASSTPTPTASSPLSVWNATDRAVTVWLDGSVIARLEPATAQDPIELPSSPPLPWRITVTTDAGYVLVDVAVERSGPYGWRTDLSCGRVDVWSIVPILEPMWVPGTPGDCGPDWSPSHPPLE